MAALKADHLLVRHLGTSFVEDVFANSSPESSPGSLHLDINRQYLSGCGILVAFARDRFLGAAAAMVQLS